MEITNKIKSKVFAQYLGQRVSVKNAHNRVGDYEILGIIFEHETWKIKVLWRHKNNANEFYHFSVDNCKLILKPINTITDEDAIEVAKICDRKKSYEIDFEPGPGKDIVRNLNEEVGLKYHVSPQQIMLSAQYLTSRGYDLPQHLLNGQTLHQTGLAIYEPETTKQ